MKEELKKVVNAINTNSIANGVIRINNVSILKCNAIKTDDFFLRLLDEDDKTLSLILLEKITKIDFRTFEVLNGTLKSNEIVKWERGKIE